MEITLEISENVQRGKAKIVKELVQQAIDQGDPAFRCGCASASMWSNWPRIWG